MIRIGNGTYVPVMRWKGAERLALRAISKDIRRRIVPLIELVPKDFVPLAEAGAIQKFGKQLAETCGWGPAAPVLLDTHLLGNAMGTAVIRPMVDAAVAYNVAGAVVTRLGFSENHWAAVHDATAGSGFELCVRVSPFEFRQAGFPSSLIDTVDRLRSSPSNIHLIIDFGAVAPNGINLRPWLDTTPRLSDWRSVTFLVGAFPKDLAELEKKEQHELPRGDWDSWQDLAATLPPRLPAFGDYTIQHGAFEEREGKHFNFSASIRYATPSGWIVMRGEGVLNEDGPGYAQWPANAQLLVERSEFKGAGYSWGDTYMSDMAGQIAKTGSAKEWLAAGINHHITVVANQLLEVRTRAVATSRGES